MSQDEIRTRVAHAGFDDHRWFGHGVGDLVGKETLLGLVMLAASGRRPTDEERQLLEELAVIITVADPRIWPLKIARLVASYGSAMSGFGAAQLCVESDALGPWIGASAAELLAEVREAAGGDAGDEAFARAAREAIKKRPNLYGYGVPLRERDERYVMLRARLELRGRTSLPWWRVQERLTGFVRAERRTEPNIGIAAAAMLLDMGLSPEEGRVVTVFLMEHLFLANAVEGAQQAAAILRELPAESVEYTGPAPRDSPRRRT
jgi:hypothetical protein